MKTTTAYLAMLNQVAESNDLETLSVLDVQVSVAYGYLNVKYGRLEAQRDVFLDEYEKEHSDEKHTVASLERTWGVSQHGQEMTQLKYELRALDTILKATKNLLIRLSIEKRESE